ncbi:MAG: adenosylcobinamide-GDP ribazoletransferase [Acidobacteriia bacterium]|nr:adenosylcobinamide-GDP ribazoletransferase [Terriglobia bacterium]
MRTFIAAVGLLTRIPVPASPEAETAGKATGWFPLVGALIGATYAGVAWLAAPRLPSAVVAVLLVIAEALITGALHMDGLADTADGFGGGKSREDTLRIMRDPAIGSYGAIALVLLVAFKMTVLTALLDRHSALPYLVLTPVLGRWTAAPLAYFLPYARPSKSAPQFVGIRELLWSTLLTAAITAAVNPRYGFVCWAAVAALAALFGAFCRRKIGGITGDTLGAAIEIAECLVLLVALLL